MPCGRHLSTAPPFPSHLRLHAEHAAPSCRPLQHHSLKNKELGNMLWVTQQSIALCALLYSTIGLSGERAARTLCSALLFAHCHGRIGRH